jgi:hypothetical protein
MQEDDYRLTTDTRNENAEAAIAGQRAGVFRRMVCDCTNTLSLRHAAHCMEQEGLKEQIGKLARCKQWFERAENIQCRRYSKGNKEQLREDADFMRTVLDTFAQKASPAGFKE